MKLGFISTMNSHPWGGSENLWFQTALEATRTGHQVNSLSKRWQPIPKNICQLSEQGASTHLYGSENSLLSRVVGKTSRLLSKTTYWQQQLDAFNKTKHDLLIISMAYQLMDHNLAVALTKSETPYILIVQAALEEAWPSDSSYQYFREVYSRAKQVFFVSHANRMLTETQLNLELNHASIACNPYSIGYDEHIAYPAIQDTYHIGCFARIDAYPKGYDLLLDVFSQHTWRERNVKLHLYGTGHNVTWLVDRLKHKSLSSVTYHGHTQNVRGALEMTHAVALCSRYEGLPIALVEAMMASKPVITTSVSGNPEIVEDNVTGFLAKSTSQADIREAFERAWRQRLSWEAMGQVGKKVIQAKVPLDPAREMLKKIEGLG